jgi:hypothetical protein
LLPLSASPEAFDDRLSRWPVLKIHHATARQMARKIAAAMPQKLGRTPLI